jgi:hypothetical protein
MEGEFGDELDVLPDDPHSNIGTAVEYDGSYGVGSAARLNGVRDRGVAMQTSSPARLSPGSAANTRKHTRQRSLYDGSDYGDDSDLENEGISPALEWRMAPLTAWYAEAWKRTAARQTRCSSGLQNSYEISETRLLLRTWQRGTCTLPRNTEATA